MNNAVLIIVITFLLLLISILSFELGIAGVTPQSALEVSTTLGNVEGGLWAFVNYFIGMAKTFFALMTFQTSLPTIFNAFLMIPMSMGILFIIFTLIRGGAR